MADEDRLQALSESKKYKRPSPEDPEAKRLTSYEKRELKKDLISNRFVRPVCQGKDYTQKLETQLRIERPVQTPRDKPLDSEGRP